MKKQTKKAKTPPERVMRDEYRFDYSKAKPNRFAAGFKESTISVVLDKDVAAVFKTPEAVNNVLRAIIGNLPAATTDK